MNPQRCEHKQIGDEIYLSQLGLRSCKASVERRNSNKFTISLGDRLDKVASQESGPQACAGFAITYDGFKSHRT